MWSTNFVILWTIRSTQIMQLAAACLTMVAREIARAFHDFQARGTQWQQLRSSYTVMDLQLRVSHCGLFLRFRIILWLRSTIFFSVINVALIFVLIAAGEQTFDNNADFSCQSQVTPLRTLLKLFCLTQHLVDIQRLIYMSWQLQYVCIWLKLMWNCHLLDF
jgi:hypothetical protein